MLQAFSACHALAQFGQLLTFGHVAQFANTLRSSTS